MIIKTLEERAAERRSKEAEQERAEIESMELGARFALRITREAGDLASKSGKSIEGTLVGPEAILTSRDGQRITIDCREAAQKRFNIVRDSGRSSYMEWDDVLDAVLDFLKAIPTNARG